LRGYRIETDRLALSLGAFAALGKGREPESASGSRRGLAPLREWLVVPRKTPITLKSEIAALLASGNVGSFALVLDENDIVLLLKAAIQHEGSISAFETARH
jgi:hypothetical protein